jgi:hypothetical protein
LVNLGSDTSVGWSWASLTPKASSRGEAFPHTYKLTTSPFHNRCGTTPTISPSHIGPWVGAATTRFSRGLLGRDLLVNLGSDTSVGWSWASLTPKASSRGEAFPHTYKLTTSPFHNRCGTTPTISPSHIGPWVGAATTRFSRGLLGRDLLVNLGSDTSVGWSWASLTPKASSRDEAFPHTYKLTTSPFHNRCGTTPTADRS